MGNKRTLFERLELNYEVMERKAALVFSSKNIIFDETNLTYEGMPSNYIIRYWGVSKCKTAQWYNVFDTTQKDPCGVNPYKKVNVISVKL